jgi:hypothetical protein
MGCGRSFTPPAPSLAGQGSPLDGAGLRAEEQTRRQQEEGHDSRTVVLQLPIRMSSGQERR